MNTPDRKIHKVDIGPSVQLAQRHPDMVSNLDIVRQRAGKNKFVVHEKLDKMKKQAITAVV